MSPYEDVTDDLAAADRLIVELKAQVRNWREVATYLASCHVATLEHEGTLKSTSKASVRRFRDICATALKMLRAADPVDVCGTINTQWVIDRLKKALGEAS